MLKFNALSKFGNQCRTAAVPHAALTRNGKIDFPQKYLLKIVRYNKIFVTFVLEKPHGARITKNEYAKDYRRNT